MCQNVFGLSLLASPGRSDRQRHFVINSNMPNVLIIGATRGLGASLVQKYAAENNSTVFATSRSENAPFNLKNVTVIPGIDLSLESAGAKLASHFKDTRTKLDVVIITAGYFGTETFDQPKWEEEVKM